jgi:hypothetical protein
MLGGGWGLTVAGLLAGSVRAEKQRPQRGREGLRGGLPRTGIGRHLSHYKESCLNHENFAKLRSHAEKCLNDRLQSQP